MPYNVKKSQKLLAIQMRKKGFSYGEILKELAIPRSTLASWIKNVKLDAEKKARLEKKRSETARANAGARVTKILSEKEKIFEENRHMVRKISRREMWLMGIVLCSGILESTSKIVSFSNSNPFLIKLFLKWIKDIGNLENDEIKLSIFTKNAELREQSVRYWSKITKIPRINFCYFYVQKTVDNKVKKREKREPPKFGVLELKVRSSSLLLEQIKGWLKGIEDNIHKA